jgi:enoyl-CoA hydratase/carnithine racemase
VSTGTPTADLILSRRDGQIGYITLNRPAAFNAISLDLMAQLEAALSELAKDSDAIIIRGAGGNFCAGADLRFVHESRSDREAMQSFVARVGQTFELIEKLAPPVVAAVEGFCLAGGFELLQACDFAVAAHDAVIGDGHVEFGQVPGGGSTVRLARMVGRQAALGILLTGDRFSGAEAAARGLVHRAFPAGGFEQGLAELAALLASRGGEPLRAIKQTVIGVERLPLAGALAQEREMFLTHVAGAAAGAGLDRFLERRKPSG